MAKKNRPMTVRQYEKKNGNYTTVSEYERRNGIGNMTVSEYESYQNARGQTPRDKLIKQIKLQNWAKEARQRHAELQRQRQNERALGNELTAGWKQRAANAADAKSTSGIGTSFKTYQEKMKADAGGTSYQEKQQQKKPNTNLKELQISENTARWRQYDQDTKQAGLQGLGYAAKMAQDTKNLTRRKQQHITGAMVNTSEQDAALINKRENEKRKQNSAQFRGWLDEISKAKELKKNTGRGGFHGDSYQDNVTDLTGRKPKQGHLRPEGTAQQEQGAVYVSPEQMKQQFIKSRHERLAKTEKLRTADIGDTSFMSGRTDDVRAILSAENAPEMRDILDKNAALGTYDQYGDPRLMTKEGREIWKKKYNEDEQNYNQQAADLLEQSRKTNEQPIIDRFGPMVDIISTPEIDNERTIINGEGYTEEEKANAQAQLRIMLETGVYYKNLNETMDYLTSADAMGLTGEELRRAAFDELNGRGEYDLITEGMDPAQKEKLDERIDEAIQFAKQNNFDVLIRDAESMASWSKRQAKAITAAEERQQKYDQLMAGEIEVDPTWDPNYLNYQAEYENMALNGRREYKQANNSGVDTVYAYLGGIGFNPNDDLTSIPYAGALLMNRKERDKFISLYKADKKNKTNEAWAFYQGLEQAALNPLLNYYETMGQRETARRIPVTSSGATLFAHIVQPAEFLANMPDRIKALTTGESNGATDPYGHNYTATRMKQNVREFVASDLDEAWGKGWGKRYQGIMSGLDSGLNVALAKGMGFTSMKAVQNASLALFTTQAFETSLQNSLANGTDPFGYNYVEAWIDAAIETTTEIASVGAWMKKPKNLLTFLAHMFIEEPSEEMAGAIVEPYVKLLAGHANQWETRAQDILAAGGYIDDKGNFIPVKNEDEATRQAMHEWNHEIYDSAVQAMWSIGPSAVYQGSMLHRQTRLLGKSMQRTNVNGEQSAAKQLAEAGAKMDQDSYTYKLSQKMNEKLAEGKKVSNYDIGLLTRNMMEEANENAGRKAQNVLRGRIFDDLEGKDLQGAETKAMDRDVAADLLTKAIVKGIDNLSQKERDAIHYNNDLYNIYKTYRYNEELQKEIGKEQENETAAERKAMSTAQRTMIEAELLDTEAAGEIQLADEEEWKNAEGDEKTGSRRIIYDGKRATLGNLIETQENGKTVLRYQVKVDGQEEPVLASADQIRAITPGTAGIVYLQSINQGFYSGMYTNRMLAMMDDKRIQNKPDTLMKDAKSIRIAAMTQAEMPQTELPADVAEELYNAAKAEFIMLRQKDVQNRTAQTPGEGKIIYKGKMIDTESDEFSNTLEGLDDNTRQYVKDLSDLARAMGVNLNIRDNSDITKELNSETEAFKNEPQKIYGFESRTGITVNIEGMDYQDGKESGRHNIGITFGHETVHWLQRNSMEGYNNLLRYVMDAQRQALGEKGLQDKIEYVMRTQNLDLDHAISEIVAESCDNIFNNEEVVKHIQQTNETLYKGLRGFAKDLMNRVKTFMRGHERSMSKYSKNMLNEQMREIGRLYNLAWDEAISGKLKVNEKEAEKAKKLYEKYNGKLSEKQLERLSSAQADEFYMDAMAANNNAAMRAIRDEIAQRYGYNTELAYHGTPDFGFTEFNLGRGRNAIFVVFGENAAKHYSLRGNVRNISERALGDLQKMTPKQLLEEAQKWITDRRGDKVNSIELLSNGKYRISWFESDEQKNRTMEYNRREMIQEIRMTAKRAGQMNGTYQLYTRPGKQFVLDAHNNKSTEIHITGEQINTDMNTDVFNTRMIAKWAMDNGYDSVRINNVLDAGGVTTDYGIFFHQNDVKSADLITYDDQGEVIKPTERFSEDADIRYSLAKYSQHEIDNWKNSKQIVLYTGHDSLVEFYNYAISNNTSNKRMYFGKVDKALANKIKADAGVETEGLNVAIYGNEIRKITQKHGDAQKEALQGQLPVNEDVIEEIIDVIGNPDNIKNAGLYEGHAAIEFSKDINGVTTTITYVVPNKHDLKVQTIYKHKNRSISLPGYATNAQPPLTSKTTQGTAPINTLTQNKQNNKNRFSTAQMDDEYMAAVESGNVQRQNELVEAAAKKAGYTIKAYHGTPNGKFNVFEKDKVGTSTDFGKLGRGFYFTAKKQVAEYYAGYLNSSTVMPVYLKLNNPFVLDSNYDNMTVREMYDSILGEGGPVDEYRSEELTRWLVDHGYDGIIADDEYMVLDSENIKSADPVTYDDNGNVIPLSERFNEEKNDIRWSTAQQDPTESANFKRWFGNSKVVNADGTPKIMYHGTRAQFSVFDTTKAKAAGTWGKGFYFTNEPSHAGQYGDQMAVYLRAENPLTGDGHNITKEQLIKFLQAVAEDEDLGLDNYGQDATPESVADDIYSGKGDLLLLNDVNSTAIGNFKQAMDLFNKVNGTNYDSVITDLETVVYKPNQVKSATENNGDYSLTNDDIYYSTAQQTDTREQELRQAWSDARDEMQAMRQQVDEMKPEVNSWTKRMMQAQDEGRFDELMPEYKEWEKGYTAARDKLAAAEKKYREANKAFDDYIENRDVAAERKAISDSGLSEADYRRRQAVNEFGYTTDFREAGYLLPNGRMLNFCGSKGQHYGMRGEDHRGIGRIYASSEMQGSKAMTAFMNDGNIRVMAETPGIDINSKTEPTTDQYAMIRSMARRFAGEEYFNVDFSDNNGNVVDSIEYDGRVNADRVVNDIKTFYRTGAAPQQSITSQFHYSTFTDEQMDVDVWMMNATPSSVQTEDERQLLQAYRGLKVSMNLCLHRIVGYQQKIKALEEHADRLTPAERDDLIELRNKVAKQQQKMAEYENELFEITSQEGYARKLYQFNIAHKNFLAGKTAEQVRQAVEDMLAEVQKAQEQIRKDTEDLKALAQEQAVKTMRSFLGKSSLGDMAAMLRKAFDSNMNKAELQDRLAEISIKMAAGKDVNSDIELLTQDLMDKVRGYRSDNLEYIRGTTLVIGQHLVNELKAEHVTLKELRSALKGSGVTLKTAENGRFVQTWEELRENNQALPEVNNLSESDAIRTIIDYVESEMRSSRGAEQFGGNFDELALLVRSAATNVTTFITGDAAARKQITSLMKQIQDLSSKTEKTAADMDELDRQMDAVIKTGHTATAYAGSLSMDVNSAIEYYNKTARVAAEKERTKVRKQLIEQLRSENTKRLIEQQEEFKKKLEKDRTARQLAQDNLVLRRRITTVAKRMANLITKETDIKNIPEQAKPLARQMLRMLVNHDRSFRMVMFGDRAGLNRIEKVLDILDTRDGKFKDEDLDWLIRGKGENADYDMYDRVITDLINIETGLLEYASAEGKGNVSLMDRKNALTKVQKAVTEIYSVIKHQQEVEIEGRKWNVDTLAMQLRNDMRNSRFKGNRWFGTGAAGARAFVIAGNTTPEYFIKNLHNGTMTYLFGDYHNAENRAGLLYQMAADAMNSFAEEAGFDTWDPKKKFTITLEKGGTVKLNVEQMMQIYATWKREQTLQAEIGSINKTFHLESEGFYVENDEHKIGQREVFKEKSYRMTANDFAVISKALTQEQKEYVDKVVEFLTRTMGAIGNEASMRMYGIKKYNEQYYFPFEVWSGVKSIRSDKGAAGSLESHRGAHPSFSKRLMNNAGNALVMRGFTQTAAKHIVGMINYGTFAPAIENLQKVMNVQVLKGETAEDMTLVNMWTEFGEAYGKDAKNYLKDFQQAMNGGVDRNERTPYDKLLSTFRKSAVAGSLSVAFQQPLSYIRAIMEIDPKYLAQAIVKQQGVKNTKAIVEEMRKYSGVAVLKKMGKFDMGLGQSAQQFVTPEGMQSKAQKAYQKTSDITTALPELMDTITWSRLWLAAKLEQQALHKDMDVNSDAFLQMVADRFNEIIRMTQVYDSVMVRSPNMRSKNIAVKQLTSFMAEPTLTMNVLADAVVNAKDSGGKTRLAKACAAYILSAVGQALVKGLMGAGRNPDKKKTKAENIAYRFAYNFINEINPLSLLPGYSDIITLIKDGELTDDATSVLGKIFAAGGKAQKLLEGKSTDAWRDVEDSVGVVWQLCTNIPLKNLSRDARAMWNYFIANPFAKRDTSAGVLKYQFADLLANADNLLGALNKLTGDAIYKTTNSAYYERIYQAEKTGDTKAAEEMKDYVTLTSSAQDPEKNLNEALRSMAKKDADLSGKEKVQAMLDNGGTAQSIKTWITKEYKAKYVAASVDERRRMMNELTAMYKMIGVDGEAAMKIVAGWVKESKKESK